MRVLAVEVDQRAPDLGELAHGREPAVDVRAAATVGRQHAREHRLVAGLRVHEPALDARFVGAVAHQRGVGAPADEQLDRLDDAASCRRRSRR